MPKVLDNIITAAKPNPASHTVALTWANGERTVSSFRHLVGKGVFAAFADPAFFAQARIGDGGRSLEWPGELDFCADALWFEAHPEDAPEQQHEGSPEDGTTQTPRSVPNDAATQTSDNWCAAPKDGSEINIQFHDGTIARARWSTQSGGRWEVQRDSGNWVGMRYEHGVAKPVVWWP